MSFFYNEWFVKYEGDTMTIYDKDLHLHCRVVLSKRLTQKELFETIDELFRIEKEVTEELL